MEQEILMEFLQLSEMLKTGKKHYKKHGHQKKEKEHHEHCHGKEDGKKGGRMSFATRMTLWLLFTQGSLNQRNIAKSMNISAQAVSEIMKKLLEKEFIRRESGELNNENIITLTEDGEVVAKKIDARMKLLSENIFNEFTAEELETLARLLDKMQKNKEALIADMNEIE
ncbi:MAG: MarR family transcriptional regulator [Bacillota bacterium]